MKKIILALIISIVGLNTALVADTIKVGFGLSLPPYVIKDSLSGMEYDIIAEALKRSGHTMVPKFYPAGKLSAEAFIKEEIDAVATTNKKGKLQGFSSKEVIRYQNYAFSLKSKSLKISNVGDMEGKSIVAFENASKYLGTSFARLTKRNDNYREIAEQATQIKLFYSGSVDIIITDKNIFKYRSQQLKNVIDVTPEIVMHEIFKPSKYGVTFRDKKIRDDFNKGLKEMRDDGSYEKIISKY